MWQGIDVLNAGRSYLACDYPTIEVGSIVSV